MAKKTKKKAPAKKTTSKKTTTRKTTSKKSSTSGGRGRANAAFMQPMTPSPSLAAVVGNKPMPRTEVVKKLWAYIRKHNLQDPKNRRNIRADAALKEVFGGKSTVSMFEMTKLVNNQLEAAS